MRRASIPSSKVQIGFAFPLETAKKVIEFRQEKIVSFKGGYCTGTLPDSSRFAVFNIRLTSLPSNGAGSAGYVHVMLWRSSQVIKMDTAYRSALKSKQDISDIFDVHLQGVALHDLAYDPA